MRRLPTLSVSVCKENGTKFTDLGWGGINTLLEGAASVLACCSRQACLFELRQSVGESTEYSRFRQACPSTTLLQQTDPGLISESKSVE